MRCFLCGKKGKHDSACCADIKRCARRIRRKFMPRKKKKPQSPK